jgi:glycosyltransferase involved in cell wall biosynthesis
MKKIAIIQPAIPGYRIPFFNELSKIYDITLFSTEHDFLGINTPASVADIDCDLVLSDGFTGFFEKLYWHRKLPILKILGGYEFIVINGNPRILNYMLIVILGFLFSRKIIWWGHGQSAGSFGLFYKLRKLIMFLPSAILVYADEEKKYFKRTVSALNNGLDSEYITDVKTLKNYRYFSTGTIPSILFIGRLTEKAKFSLLISALKDLSAKYILHVIGDISKKNTERFFARHPDLRDAVVFHGEINDEQKLCDVFGLCSLFVYPGAVGLSLIHAFNYGLPAIIHDDILNHMPEAHAHKSGFNGLDFRFNDSSSLKRAILQFSELSKQQREDLSAGALKTIENRFNVKCMVKNFNLCIDSIT